MDDLLPIIIVVVISLVGSAMRNAQKKRAKDNPKPINFRPETEENSIFDWLDKINNNGDDPYQEFEEEEISAPVVAETTVEEKPREKHQSYQSPYANYTGFITPEEKKDLVQREGISQFKKNNITIESKKGERQVLKSKIKQQFNLKQAVIHSVVLNRKYH